MNSDIETLYQCLQEDNALEKCWLSPDETKALIKFCTIWDTPYKIAISVGLSKDKLNKFLKEYNDNFSTIRNIVDLARLKQSAEIRANAAIRAKESVSGEKAFRELMESDKVADLRKALVPVLEDPEVPHNIPQDFFNERTHFAELQAFFENGTLEDNIPDRLIQYWNKLNLTVDMLKSFQARAQGTRYIIKVLMKKLGCSESYAYRIMREAQYFFNVQEDKSLIYSRLLEDLEKVKCIAWEKGDDKTFTEAIKVQHDIAKSMRDNKDIPQEVFEGRVIITSHDPQEFGIEPVSRTELAGKIKKFKISSQEKQRLLNEINATDVTAEDISE